MKNIARWVFNLVAPFWNPLHTFQALKGLPSYISEWQQYSHLAGAEPLKLAHALPQLRDRTKTTSVDLHYFYTNGWAMRRIFADLPRQHVDVGSAAMFVNLLSAVLPVTFVDYRPLEVGMQGLSNQSGDILNLPFGDATLESLSCLHVAEHIGLGRYGDPLNPQGTRQACKELKRVLASGGKLYFVMPVGRERVCFNAHRIHSPHTVIEYFDGLELTEFSGVHDNGQFIERAELDAFSGCSYACGMFHFIKP